MKTYPIKIKIKVIHTVLLFDDLKKIYIYKSNNNTLKYSNKPFCLQITIGIAMSIAIKMTERRRQRNACGYVDISK